jgi:segregation and condensation protein B
MNESHIRNVIEAALLAAGKPLQPLELVELFDEGARPQLQDVIAALNALMAEYSNRGIEIKETAAGFRIQVRREMANEISRLWPERPARYSRALLETLALIAYRQPITRAEIEAVRGVAVNPNILKTVIERNWVRVVGHRDVPGRPELLGTTRDFLDYFGLRNLEELPPLAELKTIGDIKVQFDLPDPGPIPLASEVGSDGKQAVSGEVVEGSALTDEIPAHVVAAVAKAGVADGETEVDLAVSGASEEDSAEQGAAASSATVAVDDATTDGTVPAQGDATAEGGVTAQDDTTARRDVTTEGDVTTGGGNSARKRRGKARASDTALHEAEEFAASVDADLAAGDDDGSDDDELSAAGPDSSELVAGPRDIDD